ncbi:hypothetical protein [Lysobacter capsici]|uniref:hypothetical protein n=1 Tax=Lysobacter capsici TaxID=435897 RepID=UPI00128B9C21|nr:hypothetical protein [Lysobacter capsici]
MIHIKLVSNGHIRRDSAVADVGHRPRVVYQFNGMTRVAVGRRGEHARSLATEIALKYPGCELVAAPFDGPELREVVEYVAGWQKSEHAAKAMGIRKSTFLSLAKDPTTVERAVAMDDDFSRRLWAQESELLPDPQPARTAIWKTRRSGELTTRGKPKLQKIGEECWYGGTQLHRSPPVAGRIQRWQESDLIGLPVPGDWGTKPYVDD